MEFGWNLQFCCLYVSFADALNSFQGNGANPIIPTACPGSSWKEETWSSHKNEATVPRADELSCVATMRIVFSFETCGIGPVYLVWRQSLNFVLVAQVLRAGPQRVIGTLCCGFNQGYYYYMCMLQ